MQIREIDDNIVQVLVPHRDPVLQFFAVEKAWYATDDDRVLGTVIYHRCNNSWAYVVLCTDERGLFRWVAGDVKLSSRQAAKEQLHAEMQRIAESEHTAFERPIRSMLQGARSRIRTRRARRIARRAVRRELS
ncbi:MAG TPA: hypothetical protein VFE46_17430 [Pirellulales bacterium]|jgi:hypothetical protein|nr:hypothetical protein [Pirellulales bacterium]